MTKEKLQSYINNTTLPMIRFSLGEQIKTPYSIGYAKDEKGWYTYEVSERQDIFKEYFETEDKCIEDVLNRLKFELKNTNQTLPDLEQTGEGWIEEKQRAWLNEEITDSLNTKESLIKCSEQLGYGTDIYKMIVNSSFEDIINLKIINYEQVQVLDIVYYEINDAVAV